MRSLRGTLTVLLFLLPLAARSGPAHVEVTAEKPQRPIQVEVSHLGEGFWGFSVVVDLKQMEVPGDVGAYLILQNEKGNLVSTPILPAELAPGRRQFYAGVHADLLKWARFEVRSGTTAYVVRPESFKRRAEK